VTGAAAGRSMGLRPTMPSAAQSEGGQAECEECGRRRLGDLCILSSTESLASLPRATRNSNRQSRRANPGVAGRTRPLIATTKSDQSAKPSTTRTKITQRIRILVAGRTGLEPTTSGCNPAEEQGSEALKLVSRCIPCLRCSGGRSRPFWQERIRSEPRGASWPS
jgi:hypothetical protein